MTKPRKRAYTILNFKPCSLTAKDFFWLHMNAILWSKGPIFRRAWHNVKLKTNTQELPTINNFNIQNFDFILLKTTFNLCFKLWWLVMVNQLHRNILQFTKVQIYCYFTLEAQKNCCIGRHVGLDNVNNAILKMDILLQNI